MSLNEIVRRHEPLRTWFDSENREPVQHIEPELTLTVEGIDLTCHAATEREGLARHIADDEAAKPFDLSIAPLLGAKRLERLHDAVPDPVRLAVLWNPTLAAKQTEYRETDVAAQKLGIQLQSVELRVAAEAAQAPLASTSSSSRSTTAIRSSKSAMTSSNWRRTPSTTTGRGGVSITNTG